MTQPMVTIPASDLEFLLDCCFSTQMCDASEADRALGIRRDLRRQLELLREVTPLQLLNRAEDHAWDQTQQELDTILLTMNLPAKRSKDLGWLSRNIGFDNAAHPQYERARILISRQLRIADRKEREELRGHDV